MDALRSASGLEESAPGMWTAQVEQAVSYPTAGHVTTQQIEAESFWYAHRQACVLAAIGRHPPAGTIYDIGGGIGTLALALREAGYSAVVVEPLASGAKVAWDRGARPVVNATTRAASFATSSLPAVGLFDVVEHVPDHERFMEHIHDLLVPGGRAYITVPAFEWLWSQDDVEAGHHRRYNVDALSSLLTNAGFDVEYSTYLFRPLPLPILAVRVVGGRLGRRDPAADGVAARDHLTTRGWPAAVLSRMLRPEVRAVDGGRRMSVGSSILMVAHKS